MEIGNPAPGSDARDGDEFMKTTVPRDDQNFLLDLLEFRFFIDWLMTVAGVSSPRLAKLFDTSAENIRRLKYLAPRQIEPSLITFVPELDLEPSTAIHGGVGIRSYRDILVHSEKPSPTTEGLREQIDIIFSLHQLQYQFLAGAQRLARLKQRLGHISEARRLAVAGVLEQKISWFLVHSGFSRSAVSHASLSLWLLQTAYYQKSHREDAREFIKTALIASHANLLAARPAAALQVLDIMRAASERIGAPLGSDYYRQRGVAFFQLGRTYDYDAKKCFEQSEQQMRRLGEGNEAQALMTGTRHVNLLVKPDWEGSLRVVDAAEKTFAAESLEVSMTRHWAAACGFLTGDSRIRQWAQEKVTENYATARRYGHQATISKLLSITPDLGLPRGLEAVWLRKALYQNAFRFK
jgi:hypothetical protein